MDFLERFSSKFGTWYEGLFGGEGSGLRPKDVLRKITTAMEDHRMEGFDGKVYVPNKYVLELSVSDPEERDYLLSFLDEEELESVLRRFMLQNHYHARGPLDFTISEAPVGTAAEARERLRVKTRFEKGELPSAAPVPRTDQSSAEEDDLATVMRGDDEDDEPGTVPAVAWAALAVIAPDGRKSHFSLTRPVTTIGRSRNTGNDSILDNDGMVSKVHARIEREPDGRFVVYDAGSTNGLKVNGNRVEGNRILKDGDELLVGATKIVFQYAGDEPAVPSDVWEGQRDRPAQAGRPRLRTEDGREHVLASETLIGRAITSDIVVDGPGVAMRHARVVVPDSSVCYLEALPGDQETSLNGVPVIPGHPASLSEGDQVRIGRVPLVFLRKSS